MKVLSMNRGNDTRKWKTVVLFATLMFLASATLAGNTTQAPTVTLTASTTKIIIAPPECEALKPGGSFVVELSTQAQSFGKAPLTYYYTVTGGRVTGEGSKATWDLTSVSPGTYTATVDVA